MTLIDVLSCFQQLPEMHWRIWVCRHMWRNSCPVRFHSWRMQAMSCCHSEVALYSITPQTFQTTRHNTIQYKCKPIWRPLQYKYARGALKCTNNLKIRTTNIKKRRNKYSTLLTIDRLRYLYIYGH